jgi:hypothetical protein
MRCTRALPTNQLMLASSCQLPAATGSPGGPPGKKERPHPSLARMSGNPSIIMSPDPRPWTQISSLVPFGDARACGKIGRGRSPRSSQLGAGEPEDKFDPGSRWWGCALLPRARGSDSFPSLFGSRGRPTRCNRLRGKDIEDGRSRGCRTGGAADRGSRPGQGRSGGMCASAEPPPARLADAGAARLRHHHGTTAGDGGLVAALGGAAGGDGIHQLLLEGGALPAGGRGI